MLYYGKEYNIHYRQTHPPAKGNTYFQYAPNFFFQNFFQNSDSPCVCSSVDPSPQTTPPIFERWGYPPHN